MTKITTKRLLELDSLRGIAAVFVVLFHLTMHKPQGKYFLNLGLTGVELFFMISGFVILMTLEKVKSSKEFVVSRLIRLYPTYWTCVTITALFMVMHSHSISTNFLVMYFTNLTMFHNYFFQQHLDPAYWTMIIEMLFYIFMLAIYRQGHLNEIELIGMIVLLPLFIYGTMLSYQFPILNTRLVRFAGLVNFFPLFFSGILYYKLKYDSISIYRVIMLVCSFIVQITLFHTIEGRFGFITLSEYAIMLTLYNAVFLLYTFDKLNFIVNRVTVFFGNISYPLYLIHQYISLVFIFPFLIKYLNFWVACIIDVSIVVGIAYLINIFVEKPTMKYARQRWLKKPSNDLNTLEAVVTI
jgi:peptidoglycan/LPS O-acetylase OafA/YrhL